MPTLKGHILGYISLTIEFMTFVPAGKICTKDGFDWFDIYLRKRSCTSNVRVAKARPRAIIQK